MKACGALLCLLPLVSSAATQIQTCTTTPNATGANQLIGCPTQNVVWGPTKSTDLVRAIKPDNSQGWIPFNTLTPSTAVVPKTGGWVAFGTLTVVVPPSPIVPPVQPTHAYLLSWDAPTTASDGSTLTDLTGYIAQTGPSVAGPWAGTQAVKQSPVTFTLASNVQQCFQVVAVSQSLGASDPATVCVPAIPITPPKPAAPGNVKAN